MRNALRLILLSLLLVGVGAIGQTHAKLTYNQGRLLVLASLSPEESRLPGLEANVDKDSSTPKFSFYTVTWAGKKSGSVVVGNFAVDLHTADVFSATVACYEQKNKRLEALQSRMRSRLHLTAAEYQKLKTRGPLCE